MRWRARYVDDEGREHAKGFTRKADAQTWLDNIVTAQVTGNYVDPRHGKVTFTSFYREWSTRQVWVPGTRRAMDLSANSVTFGDLGFADLRPSHIEAWVKSMQDKPLETEHDSYTVYERPRSHPGRCAGSHAVTRRNGQCETAAAT
jgi:hypothetical protein